MLDRAGPLSAGVRNILEDCACCTSGDTVLLVHEHVGDGYYDPDLAAAVANEADALGIRADLHSVPLYPDATSPPADLQDRMDAACCTVFFARIGDQLRFRPTDSPSPCVVSYALDQDTLASPFGTIPFQAFLELKDLLNAAIAKAEEIHVTCPLGTDFRGDAPQHNAPGRGDVTIRRFPISVFSPVDATGFCGKIAVSGFLTGTGARYYDPYNCALTDVVTFQFDGCRLTDISGSAPDVAAAQAHFDHVAELYDLDRAFVHSWHAGIHPACRFPGTARSALERWSGSAFGNPRLLHFHTCGAEPPGEISLNVLDPTIRLDGVPIWQDGVLRPERICGGAALLAAYPDMALCFDAPEQDVGQGPDGRL